MTESAPVVTGGDQPEKPRRIARFGTFEVDLQTGELRRNGTQVRIQVQPFRILGLLLERSGEIVTREELRVRKLREALGDSAENPRFVETQARRGYRFIAPVSWESPRAAPKKRRLLIPIALVILVATSIASIFIWRRPAAAAPPNPIDAVAVLPFTNEDAQSQHLSDGMTEILIDTLSRVPDLRVMARTTVFDYKGKKIDPREAGRALNVSGVVVGNLRRRGDQYEIHVELIDVKDGTHLWGDHYDATGSTLSSVQSRISEELTDQLRQGVSRERRVASKRYTRDPQAYDAYLWGLYAWNKRDVPSALKYFNQAIERDPQFAAAYAGLANTYGVMVGYGLIPVADGTAKVLANAGKALQLDPNNAEALVSIATTKFRNLWDFSGAEADYRRALALNPNYATGHQWYADLLRVMGRWQDARRELDIAHRLDPRSGAINTMRCAELYYERRYREAVQISRESHVAYGCVAHSLMAMGDLEAALPLLKLVNVPDADRDQIEAAYRKSGRRGFYLQSAELLARRQSETVETPVEIASFYAQAGDKEKAFQRRVSVLTNIGVDPAFDPLRSDPRFDDLLRRIGLPKVIPPS